MQCPIFPKWNKINSSDRSNDGSSKQLKEATLHLARPCRRTNKRTVLCSVTQSSTANAPFQILISAQRLSLRVSLRGLLKVCPALQIEMTMRKESNWILWSKSTSLSLLMLKIKICFWVKSWRKVRMTWMLLKRR